MDEETEEPLPKPEPLPPVRRSFPVPKRRPQLVVEEQAAEPGLFSGWLVKAAIFGAGAMAGIALWTKLGPQPAPTAQVPGSVRNTQPDAPPLPPPPPDAARDVYVAPPPPGDAALLPPPPDAPQPPQIAGDAVPVPPMVGETGEPPPAAPDQREGDGVFEMLDGPPPVVASTPDSVASSELITPPDTPPALLPEPVIPPDTPPEPVKLGALEEKYIAALERSAGASPVAEKAAWAAEIQRVKTGQPLPATMDGLPDALAKLQAIYRREKDREATPAPDPAARDVELFVYAEGDAKLLLNGNVVPWATSNAGVYRATQQLKPGDVIGFELPSNRNLAVIARSGVKILFSSSERWEATSAPSHTFWTGADNPAAARVRRQKSGFRPGMKYFEDVSRSHSADYSLIFGQGTDAVGFRYTIRKADLPERK